MGDKELIKITTEFKKGLLGKRESKAMCFMICLPLQGYLSSCGIETELIEGKFETDIGTWNHFWLQLADGRILDPTADQFNSQIINTQMPKVYIGEKPKWYQVVENKVQ